MKKINFKIIYNSALMLAGLAVITVIFSLNCRKTPKTVKVIWWGSDARYEKTLNVIKLYEEQNPDIKIDAVYTSWDDYWEKLFAVITLNQTPDIFTMTKQNLPFYHSFGFISEIEGFKGFDHNTVDRELLDTGKINGKLYAVCLGANAFGLMYNKNVFDRYKIKYPNEKTTWDDIIRISDEINKKSGIWGIDYFNGVEFEFFVRSRGESEYARYMKDKGFREETAIEYFKLLRRLYEKRAFRPLKNDAAVGDSDHGTAMRLAWSNAFTEDDDGYDITMFPGPGNEQAMYVKPSMFFCIYSRSRVKKESAEFINWFITDIEANRLLAGDRGVPSVRKVREAIEKDLSENIKSSFRFVDRAAAFSKRPMDPYFPEEDRQCKRILTDLIIKVYTGRLTPEEAGKNLTDEWKDIFSH